MPQENKKLKIKDSGMKVLLEWEAAERIWFPKNRQWYLKYALLFGVLILVMARLEYYVIILGLLATMLLVFVHGTIKPWVVKHTITSKGLYTNKQLRRWEDVEFFWFARKNGQHLLYIDFVERKELPRMTLLISKEEMDEAFIVLIEKAKYGEPEEIGYGLVSKYIVGEYLPISTFIPDLDNLL